MNLIDINKNYEYIIDKNKIDLLNDEELYKEVKNIFEFIALLFSNKQDNVKKIDFL
jgi:translation initiation factor 2 gamma subunit (eIF-2gamma)